MKILMIAPEPFFQPRGTPFSEYYRIKCLTELGHTVDLVTYHIGDDVDIPGLKIIRAPRVPGINDIKIGPSLEKIPLDAALFFKSWEVAAAGNYDAIHSHEEGGLIAVFLSRLYGLPHVYDMHSSLPDQLSTFRFTKSRLIRWAFDWLEDTVLKASDAVIAICPSLVEKAKSIEPNAHLTLIENVAESHEVDNVTKEELAKLEKDLDFDNKKIILYIGTFETYQGLGMLLEACAGLFKNRDDALLLMVGGRPNQVEEIKAKADDLGIAQQCRFTGMVPHSEVPGFLKVADVLVSPRRYGDNTPLKIYSYLRSGTPIVATNLWTHTQVLNEDVAVLTEAQPKAIAEGIAQILDDRELGKRLAKAAFRLSETQYSYSRYVEKTRMVYDHIERVING